MICSRCRKNIDGLACACAERALSDQLAEALKNSLMALEMLTPEDGLCWCSTAHGSSEKEHHSVACKNALQQFKIARAALAQHAVVRSKSSS